MLKTFLRTSGPIRWLVLIGLPLSLYFSSTWVPHDTAQRSVDEALPGQPSVQPVVNLSQPADMSTEYTAPARARRALARSGGVQPLSLASADFDEDGTPDLVSGYGIGVGGILTIHRGNVDFLFPNSPEAQLRRARGEFIEAPFFPRARAIDIPTAPDFIGAGDFDNDGHCDVIVAARGSYVLYLLAGDGHGNFKLPHAIPLSGAVTALTTGEINLADGLVDIVVGAVAEDGPKVLIFESPDGAAKATPEIICLSSPATSLALGPLTSDYLRDLAIAAGHDLVIVHGHSYRHWNQSETAPPPVIEQQPFNFDIASIAIGDFGGDANHRNTVALLSKDSKLSFAHREFSETDEAAQTTRNVRISWQVDHELQLNRTPDRLVAAKISGAATDDLLTYGNLTDLQVVSRETQPNAILGAQDDGQRSGSSNFRVSAALNTTDAASVILPLRLNADALSDLVILRPGKAVPSVALTQPLTTFVVLNTNDSGAGSLRQAITDANNNPGADAISFNISGAGVNTITPSSALPTITGPVTIDGTTEPGFNGTPLIELNGTSAGFANGFNITGGSTTIRGFVINRFNLNGIQVGTSGNDVIQGDYIGTDPTGMIAQGNHSDGIFILDTSGDTIGGPTAAARNVVSGNTNAVELVNNASSVVVQGNYFGVDISGTSKVPNTAGGLGIINSPNNTIGGTTAGAANIFSGNGVGGGGNGVTVNGPAANGNLVQGNFIGTNSSGANLGNNNVGVFALGGSGQNTVGGTATGASNVIAFSGGGPGVAVGQDASDITGLQILGNLIHDNAGLGIDLGTDGVTVNDHCDGDNGPNRLQNYPVLNSITTSGGMTTVAGSLDSTANTTFRLELFSNTAADPSGFGEGQTFVGATSVTTDANCNASFSVTFPASQSGGTLSFTGTVTTPFTETSEFGSDGFACPPITLTPSVPNGSQGSRYNQGITASGGTPSYTFSISSGALPPGLKLTQLSSTVVISGEPTTPGSYNFTVKAVDANGCDASRPYTINIAVRPALLGQNDGSAKDPISTATGELYDFFDADIYLRGPLPFGFSRYYSSGLSTTGLVTSALGNNWMHNYDLRLDLNGTAAVVIYQFGQPIVFQSNGTTWTLTTADGLVYQLVQSGSLFRFFDPSSNFSYTFNPNAGGRLERIEDRSGNALTLTYSGSLLSRVADGLGRTLDFTYSSGQLTNVQDQSGRRLSFSYTGSDLTGLTDVAGEKTTYSYTTVGTRVGLLISTTRPRGNTPYAQAFDAGARVTSQTDAAGNRTSLAYDSPSVGLTTQTDPLAQMRLFRYQNGRNMVEQKDELGNSIFVTYDNQNRRASTTDRNGNTTAYVYHAPSGLLQSITYPDGSTLTCSYTATANGGFTFYDLTQAVYPDGTSERFEYDSNGNVTSRTDRLGQKGQFIYNERGQVLTTTLPTGGVVSFTYNADGTLASTQMPGAGPVTSNYDSLKRLITKRQSDGSTRSYQWDARDNIVSLTDERGATATATYDKNGLLLNITDPAGGNTAFSYTGTDLVAQITDALGQTRTVSYDALDRVKSITYPDGATTTYGYDVAGNLITITDGEGKIWRIGYDRNDQATSETTPLGERTDFARDSMGRITSATSPLGNQVRLGYDSFGRLTSMRDPLLNSTQWAYDARGDISVFTLANGIAASYTRNALEKITEVTDPNGNKWRYSFDGAGRLVSATDPLGNLMTYARDGRGRISQVALPGGGTIAITTDGVGHATRSAFSDGTTLDYTYDSRALLTSATGLTLQHDLRGDVTSSNGIDVARDSVGRIATMTVAPGKTVTYAYDRRDLLTQIQDFRGGVTGFTYDDAGRVLTISRPNGTTTLYSYDAEGNVTSISEKTGSTPTATTSFVRDKRGLVTQATRDVPINAAGQQPPTLQGTNSFDGASQIVGFNYDGLGRRLSDGTRNYSWDLASRLTTYIEGAQTTQFTYDAMGLMLSQTTGGGSRQFVWNYALTRPSISVIRQGGNDLRYYVHTPDGELLYSIEASDGSRRFYHYDEMGNTLFLTNDAGTVTDSYAYAPYGTLIASTGSTDNPFTFEGRYGVMRIGGTGLYYMRQRFFDSVNVSFLSRDRVARIGPRLIDPYQYAAGNPLVFFDGTGSVPEEEGEVTLTYKLDGMWYTSKIKHKIKKAIDVASEVISDIGGVAGSIAGDAEPIIGRAFGMAGKIDYLDKQIHFGSNMIGNGAAGELADINATVKGLKRLESLKKLPLDKLKKLGKLGDAAQVVQTGLVAEQAFTADRRNDQEADDERKRIIRTHVVQVTAIEQLYKSKKISEVQRNRMVFQATDAMEHNLLFAEYNWDFSWQLNNMVTFKNGLGTIVPVPLSWLGLTPEDTLKGKPLIDFGLNDSNH